MVSGLSDSLRCWKIAGSNPIRSSRDFFPCFFNYFSFYVLFCFLNHGSSISKFHLVSLQRDRTSVCTVVHFKASLEVGYCEKSRPGDRCWAKSTMEMDAGAQSVYASFGTPSEMIIRSHFGEKEREQRQSRHENVLTVLKPLLEQRTNECVTLLSARHILLRFSIFLEPDSLPSFEPCLLGRTTVFSWHHQKVEQGLNWLLFAYIDVRNQLWVAGQCFVQLRLEIQHSVAIFHNMGCHVRFYGEHFVQEGCRTQKEGERERERGTKS